MLIAFPPTQASAFPADPAMATAAERADVHRCAPGQDEDLVAGAMHWETFGNWLVVREGAGGRNSWARNVPQAVARMRAALAARHSVYVGPLQVSAHNLLASGLGAADAFAGCKGFAMAAAMLRRAYAAVSAPDRPARIREAIWIYDGCQGDADLWVASHLTQDGARVLDGYLPTAAQYVAACPGAVPPAT